MIEAFVATDLQPGLLPTAKMPRDSTVIDDWADIPKPQVLFIKFPGTAGRAERSSVFPANLIASSKAEELNRKNRIQVVEPHDHSRRAEPSVDKDHRYEVWTWNPPGYGRSSGRASLTTLAPAAEAFAAQVVHARGGSKSQVWLCGNSLGCLCALSLAARLSDWLPPQVAADRCLLWLRNPPELAETILRVADRYASRSWMRRVVSQLPVGLSAVETASKCKLPAVFLMSERDELVPPSSQRTIHEAYEGEHRVVKLTDIGHGGPIEEQHHAEIQAALTWLQAKASIP